MTLKTDCMYVIRSLLNQLHVFRYNVSFLVHCEMDTGENEVAAKILRVYADVVGKLPSAPLDLS